MLDLKCIGIVALQTLKNRLSDLKSTKVLTSTKKPLLFPQINVGEIATIRKKTKITNSSRQEYILWSKREFSRTRTLVYHLSLPLFFGFYLKQFGFQEDT